MGSNKRVLISSSENAIRGMLMFLLNIPSKDIVKLNIPNGVPIVYDMETRSVSFLYDDDDDNDVDFQIEDSNADVITDTNNDIVSNSTLFQDPLGLYVI